MIRSLPIAFAADAKTQVVPTNAIPDDWMGLDIGPETTNDLSRPCSASKTVLWNGPMGVFEMDAFARWNQLLLREHLAEATADSGAFYVDRGGDSVAAINRRDWPTKSAMSVPVVERCSNIWKAKNCRESRPFGHDVASDMRWMHSCFCVQAVLSPLLSSA